MADTQNTHATNAWQRHRAARSVAHQARDAAELAELLDMLGLTAAEGRVAPGDRPATDPTPATSTAKLDDAAARRINCELLTSLATAARFAS